MLKLYLRINKNHISEVDEKFESVAFGDELTCHKEYILNISICESLLTVFSPDELSS